jgi:hypothetical protein
MIRTFPRSPEQRERSTTASLYHHGRTQQLLLLGSHRCTCFKRGSSPNLWTSRARQRPHRARSHRARRKTNATLRNPILGQRASKAHMEQRRRRPILCQLEQPDRRQLRRRKRLHGPGNVSRDPTSCPSVHPAILYPSTHHPL